MFGLRSKILSCLTAVTLVTQPQLVFAEQIAKPVPPQKTVQIPQDVILGEGGLLSGQLLNEQGAVMPLSPVSLQANGKELARLTTDKNGQFHVKGLRGGVYQVASVGHQGVYRFWAPKTAPPAAQKQLTLVSHNDVVRGQFTAPPGNPFSSIGQFIAEHPIMTAGAVASAIAIPLALDDDDDPATP